MDTLEGLHMYNTVQNYFESHEESRKRRETINFTSSFRNHVECVSISFLFFFLYIFFDNTFVAHMLYVCNNAHGFVFTHA